MTMRIIVVAWGLAMLLSGCTVLNAGVGAVTGAVDCPLYRGVTYVLVGPFEGAYRGAQLGWVTDRAWLNGEQDPATLLAHSIPCSMHYAIKAFNGEGLTWSTK